jgi:hypothetical protein
MDLRRPSPSLTLLSALLLASPGAARPQVKPPPAPDAPVGSSVMRAAHGAALVEGELWGAGPDYKVHFRDGGFELTPALGRAAPRNLPLTFELEAIERGGALVHAPGGAAAPRLGEDGVVRYAHGGGIEERYETRADGLEQSFVFAAPLPGTGELVVRGRLAGELAAPLGEHAALDFTVPGQGGVHFGAVLGVDAAGRTVPGSLRYDGRALELVLPASFVDAAQYPLVLDPLIGAAFVVPGSGDHDEEDPDVAYDNGNALYLVAWHRQFSALDYDIHAQRVATSGSLVGSLILVENASGTFAINPTVASQTLARRFLVAWQERTTASFNIMARAVDAPDGGLSSAIVVVATTADETDPDAAGEQTSADDDVLVVWEREDQGIYGAQIAVPVSGGNPNLVSLPTVSADPRAYRPAIAKSGGSAGRALVVYNVLYEPGDVDVYMALLDRNGFLLDGPQGLATSIHEESEPDVDGDGTSWIVAYVGGPTVDDSELFSLRVTFNAASSQLSFFSPVTMTSDALEQYNPAVAWTPGKAFVAWQQEYEPGDMDIHARGIDPKDCEDCEPTLTLDYSSTWDAEPELASQYSGGSAGDQVLATWYSGDLGFLTVDETDVKVQRLEAFGSSGSSHDLGGNCGAGGVISTSGSIAAGNPSFAVKLNGADPSATTGMLIVHPPSAPFVCGSCSVVLPGSLFSVPLSGGAASQTLPIPCDVSIVGAQLDAQWAVLPSSSIPCPLFGSVAASARLRLTIGQ